MTKRLSLRQALLASVALTIPCAPAIAADAILDPARGGTGSNNGSASLLTLPTAGSGTITLGALLSNFYSAASYNAICDGNHHYLSTISSVVINGATINTTGFTVSQWKTLYPSLPSGANLATTDIDGLALSAAFEAATGNHAQSPAVPSTTPYYLKMTGAKGGQCQGSTPVDNTSSNIKNAVIDWRGTNLYSTAAGLVALDMTGLQFATEDSPYVTGDATLEPYSLIRGMRYAQGAATGNITLINPRTDGSATWCAVEWSEEVTRIFAPLLNNLDAHGGRTFCVDPRNINNAAATETLATISVPTNSGNALTQLLMIGGNIVCATCDGPIYINGGNEPQFIGVYTNNNNPTVGHKFAVIVYMTPDDALVAPRFDIRSEAYNSPSSNGDTAGLTGEFYLTGTNPSPAIDWIYTTFSDWSCGGATAPAGCGVIVTDPAVVTSPVLADADINIPGFRKLNVVPLFSNPAIWSGSVKHVHLPYQSNWSFVPALISGQICAPKCVDTTVPTESMTVNSEFISDGPFEHTLAGIAKVGFYGAITDGWRQALNGSTGNALTYQDASVFGCNGGYYGETATVATAQSLAPTDSIAMFTSIPGADLEQLHWDKGNSQPITVDVCLTPNFTGSYNVPFDVSNYVGTEHLVHNLALNAVAGVPQEFVFQIPPYPVVSKFSIAANTVGLRLGVNFGPGSNFTTMTPSGTGTIAGTTLNLTAITSGAFVPGAVLSGVASGTQIVSQLSGTNGGIGTYQVSISQTVSTPTTISSATQPIVGDTWTSTAIQPSAGLSNSMNMLATLGNALTVTYVRAYPGYYLMPFKPKDDTRRVAEASRTYQKTIPAGTAPNATNGYQNAGLAGAWTFTADASGSAFMLYPKGSMSSNSGTFPTATFFSPLALSANCWDLTTGADDGGAASFSNPSDAGGWVSCANAVAGRKYAVHATFRAAM